MIEMYDILMFLTQSKKSKNPMHEEKDDGPNALTQQHLFIEEIASKILDADLKDIENLDPGHSGTGAIKLELVEEPEPASEPKSEPESKSEEDLHNSSSPSLPNKYHPYAEVSHFHTRRVKRGLFGRLRVRARKGFGKGGRKRRKRRRKPKKHQHHISVDVTLLGKGGGGGAYGGRYEHGGQYGGGGGRGVYGSQYEHRGQYGGGGRG